jgi:hypothetical protein
MPTGYVGLSSDRDAGSGDVLARARRGREVRLLIVRNRSTVVQAPNSLNIGLGWWF